MASRRTVSVELANDEDCSYLDLGKYNCVAVMESQSYTSDGIFVRGHACPHASRDLPLPRQLQAITG